MAGNRITRGGVAPRALARLALVLALAAALAACGTGKQVTTAVPDPDGDAEILNRVLARQIAVVAAYGESLGALSGERLALARRLRAQEQEHVNAVIEEMRAIGAESDPPAEAVADEDPSGEAGHLTHLAELEARTIEIELGAIAQLTAPGARRVLAAIAANQAQHLVLLRQALGAGPLQSIPGAFADGTEAVP